MRMLEQKQNVAKARMKKLSEVKPEERRQVEEWMKMEPRQLINELLVPTLARNIVEIKALNKRVRSLETEVVLLLIVLVAYGCVCAL